MGLAEDMFSFGLEIWQKRVWLVRSRKWGPLCFVSGSVVKKSRLGPICLKLFAAIESDLMVFC